MFVQLKDHLGAQWADQLYPEYFSKETLLVNYSVTWRVYSTLTSLRLISAEGKKKYRKAVLERNFEYTVNTIKHIYTILPHFISMLKMLSVGQLSMVNKV